MQNAVYERKQNGEDFILLHSVTIVHFGNRAANVLVTEQPQYSVVVCIFYILQNTEILLISSDLRLIFTYSLLLALPCIFHTARHTCATLLVHQGVPITTVQKLLGHTSVRTTEVYSEVLSNTIIRDLKAVKRKKKTPDFSRVVECG